MFKKLNRKMSRLETGFSMLEAVVVVGVLLALAVGGLFAYGAITENAKKASVNAAASDVYTALQVAASDGDPETTHQKVISDWNGSTDKIRVGLASAVTVDEFCVEAIWTADETITAQNGYCPTPTAPAQSPTPTPTATTEPTGDEQAPPPPLPVGFHMANNVHVSDINGDPLPYHVTAINTQSGQTVHNASYQVGYVANFEEYVDIEANQVDTAPRSEYLVTVTVNGTNYSYTIPANQWREDNGGYEIHLDAFLENGTFRLQYPPAPAPAGSEPAQTVTYFMLNQLNIDFDNNGSPDQDYPHHVHVVNLTSGQVIWDRNGPSSGTTDLEDIVGAPSTQTPVYQFTITSPAGTYSYTTAADDYAAAGNADSRQMSWRTFLTLDGFTHQNN